MQIAIIAHRRAFLLRQTLRCGPMVATRRREVVVTSLAAVTAVGIIFRIWVYRHLLGTPNADEAVIGLMARHALHGELTAFSWGSSYGGPQEAYLTVPLFWLFGSGWLALRMVPIALNAVACVLTWLVGEKTIGRRGAVTAAALLWIWPPYTVYQLVHQSGFYASDVVYPLLLLHLAFLIAERPVARNVALFGLVLGLAVWQTPQVMPVALGIVAWILWQQPRATRHLPVGIGAVVVGGLPSLGWNMTHGFASLDQARGSLPLTSLRLLISPMLPMTIGLRSPFSGTPLLPSIGLTYAMYLILGAVFIVGAVRSRKSRKSILYVTLCVFPLLYVLAPDTAGITGNPRYLTVIVPVLALLAADVAWNLAAAGILLALATCISAVTLVRMNDWFEGTPHPTTQARGLGARDQDQLVPRDIRSLLTSLERLHVRYLYTDYWLAYRIDFDSNERITAVENELTGMTFRGGVAEPTKLEARYAPYARAVAHAPHSFIFYKKLAPTAVVIPALSRHGYQRHDLGSFVLFTPPSPGARRATVFGTAAFAGRPRRLRRGVGRGRMNPSRRGG